MQLDPEGAERHGFQARTDFRATLNTHVIQATPKIPADYLSPPEISKEFRLGRSTPHRWMREGKLPYVKLGPRSFRIRRADLESLIQSNAAAARKEKCAA